MKTTKLLGIALCAISFGLLSCGEIENPIEPTPDPRPEEVKSEITIDADIITNGLSFTNAKGEKSISFTTNEDWTISFSGSTIDEQWYSVSTTSGGKGETTVVFYTTENTDFNNRSVSVIIKSGTATQSFIIMQEAYSVLSIGGDMFEEVSNQGGTLDIMLFASNPNFTINISENANDWIQEVSRTNIHESTHEFIVTFSIAFNDNYEKRQGEIYFRLGKIERVVTVCQEASYEAGYTDGVATISKAGTMKSLLGDDYLNITSLKITGPINGDDIYYLRKMSGGYDSAIGNLNTLDLSEATIVAGGDYYNIQYNEKYYTSDNEVGTAMFEECIHLTNVILPNNTKLIGSHAFYNCTALTSIEIGSNVESIGSGAFYSCALASIAIPSSANPIQHGAFYNCNIYSVYITDLSSWCSIDFKNIYANPLYLFQSYTDESKLYLNNEELVDLKIPENITEVKPNSFTNCSLNSITIGDQVTKIGESAFDGSNVTMATIGNGVTVIEQGAFSRCDELTSVTIGSNVKRIDYNAFHCNKLKEVYCYATNPPNIYTSYYSTPPMYTFKKTNTLYVPSRCGQAYKSSSWNNCFSNIIEMD